MAFDIDRSVPKRCDDLQAVALEFASLHRQASCEESHAYAKTFSDIMAQGLFALSLDTGLFVDDRLNASIANMLRITVDLETEATKTRSHNWVASICRLARITLSIIPTSTSRVY